MVEIRRDIHRHPEIGRNEVRTSALIRKKLEEYGVDAIERPVPTAVVALIHGARGPGRCVALRYRRIARAGGNRTAVYQ